MTTKIVICVCIIYYMIQIIDTTLTETNECRKIDACKCEYENGTGINLTPATEMYISIGNESSKYFFHPCSDTKKTPSLNSVALNDDSDCTSEGYSLCLKTTTVSNNTVTTNFASLGKSSDVTFKLTQSGEVYLVYTKGKNITNIQLVCSKLSSSYLVLPPSSSLITSDEAVQQNLLFFSEHACFYQLEVPHSLSTGAVLVIILISSVFIYLGVGILFKIFVAGASGIEIIPNIEFWQDFPALIRDGARFIQNGCKPDPLLQNNQESYDAI